MYVRCCPKADKRADASPSPLCAKSCHEQVQQSYSIITSAWVRTDSGIVNPSALAVLRLTTSLNIVGCSTGISAGLVPRRILSPGLDKISEIEDRRQPRAWRIPRAQIR